MDTRVEQKGQLPDNVIALPTTLNENFFRYWVEFLKPLHSLTERETDVVVSFLKKRYEKTRPLSLVVGGRSGARTLDTLIKINLAVFIF